MIPKILSAVAALACAYPPLAVSAEPLQFISVTPDNITLTDGSPLPDDLASIGWKWLPGEGNGGVIESSGETKKNAPCLVIIAKGLEPGRDYEVFGFFWTHGFGGQKNPIPHHWPARFGLNMATMTVYGGRFSERIPWIISPGQSLGESSGVSAVVEEENAVPLKGIRLLMADGDCRLIRARVGVARADAKGCLTVYMDDFPDSIHCGRTRIDGVGVRPAPAGSATIVGTGNTDMLHLSLRAQDWHGAQRELAAGANPNALDYKGRTVLFHPVAMGDRKTVERLLKAGAKPDVDGQTISVLAAAASIGDADMLEFLLEQGCKVPSVKIDAYGQLSRFHPVIAAIKVGSLNSLKVLLRYCPELDFEKLGTISETKMSVQDIERNGFYLVSEAVAKGHDEMAAFLIDQGCDLDTSPLIGNFTSGYAEEYLQPYPLLAWAVTKGKSLEKTREAILRRGVSPVIDASITPKHEGVYGYGIVPWDALSAAVAIGDVSLTTRFLHHAEELHPRYQKALLSMAIWSGNQQIIDLLTKKFPAVAPDVRSFDPEKRPTENAVPKRVYLPRKTRLPANQATHTGSWTLAVIAEASASGPAAMLELEATNSPLWKVVDRESLKQALAEGKLAKPWENGSHKLYEFGDLMAADFMILVTQGENGKDKLLRFEGIDVASGLSIAREHIDAEAFNPNQSVKPLLDRFHASLRDARAGNRPTAVTLLPFSAKQEIPNSQAVASLFRAAAESEVDSTPGMLTVGMDEIEAIAGEQNIGAESNSYWAAAFTLEGALQPAGEDRISVTLRMRSMGNANHGIHDHTETGNHSDLVALVSLAWKRLIEKAGATSPSVKYDDQTPNQKKAEAERLLREAEWLISLRNGKEAVPLLERAHLLGANPEKLVSLHYQAIMDCLNMGGIVRGERSFRSFAKGNALMPSTLELVLYSLDEIQAMLDQMHYYLVHYGSAAAKWESPEIWETVRAMNSIRASIPKVLPDGMSLERIRQFGDAVDKFTEDYFKLRRSIRPPSLYLPEFHMFNSLTNANILRRNPSFRKEWVNMLFAAGANQHNGRIYKQSLLTDFLGNLDFSDSYDLNRFFAKTALDRFSEYSGPHPEFHELALKILSSSGDERIRNIKEYLTIYSQMGRRERHRMTLWLHPRDLIKDYGMGCFPYKFECPLAHPHSGIASISNDPTGAMDWVWNPIHGFGELVALEECSPEDVNQYLRLNPIESSYEELGDDICEGKHKGTTMEQLIGEIEVMEKVYGHPLYKSFTARWNRLYPDQGRNNQSPGKLDAHLLVDLRQLDGLRPGTFYLPTPDNKNNNKVWLYYQPYDEKQLREVDGRYNYWHNLIRQPWLVALDCDTGKIISRTNLAAAPGVDPVAASHTTSIGDLQDNAFLVQTDRQIFTQVWWRGTSFDAGPSPLTGVLVDKERGEFIDINPKITVTNTSQFFTGGSSSGAVSIGSNFYFLSEGELLSRNANPKVSLMSLSPSGQVKHITKYGRRPEQTPFDLEDRTPDQIFVDNKRMFIAQMWDFGGHYDPADDRWEMLTENRDKIKKKGHELASVAYRKLLFPAHKISKSGEFPEFTVDYDKTFPDQLEFVQPGVGNLRIPLNLEIPNGFADQPFFPKRKSDEKRDKNLPPEYYSYGERMKPDYFHLVLLHQTNENLLIGLQDGSGFSWGTGKRTGVFFPLIWAVSKAELREALKAKASN
jgi:hypothetical protein